jgi:thiol:disulfide interchange protein DsbC
MRIYFILALLAIYNSSAFAAEIPEAVTKTANSLTYLLRGNPSLDKIRKTPIAGLYEATLGSNIIYITADGKHFILGEMYKSKGTVNLTENRRNKMRMKAIDAIDETDMVVFAPKQRKTKYILNVFTDVDCGYCAKFHEDVPYLNRAGVKVRYLAFPRAGKGSDTYNTMVSVWCADDQQKAMTDAKARREIKPKTCKHPIDKLYNIGQEIGITGTPALVFSNGKLLPGYVPYYQLIPYLQQAK